MTPHPRFIRRFAAVGLLVVCASAWATHVAGSGEPVVYDGSLSPGVPATGSIGFAAPVDGYDWYCFSGTSGQPVTLTMTRTSGTILPNIQVYSGVTNSGTMLGSSGLVFVTGTSQATAGPAVVTFTPAASQSYTVGASTFTGEAGGDYTLAMTGGASATCASGGPPPVSTPVPTMFGWAMVLMSLLLAGSAAFALRRR